jgi:hypothetical protein
VAHFSVASPGAADYPPFLDLRSDLARDASPDPVHPVLRLAAALALVSRLFLTAETLVADACDGDARRGTDAARAVARWTNSSAPVSDTAGWDASTGGTPEVPGHDTHVDHCVHPHGAVEVADTDHVQEKPSLAHVEPVRAMRCPASVTTAPRLRPPIA